MRGTKLSMQHLSTRHANMPRVQITKFPGHECELQDSLINHLWPTQVVYVNFLIATLIAPHSIWQGNLITANYNCTQRMNLLQLETGMFTCTKETQ